MEHAARSVSIFQHLLSAPLLSAPQDFVVVSDVDAAFRWSSHRTLVRTLIHALVFLVYNAFVGALIVVSRDFVAHVILLISPSKHAATHWVVYHTVSVMPSSTNAPRARARSFGRTLRPLHSSNVDNLNHSTTIIIYIQDHNHVVHGNKS